MLRDSITQWKLNAFTLLVKLYALLRQNERISLKIFCMIQFSQRLTRHLVKILPHVPINFYLLFIIECSKKIIILVLQLVNKVYLLISLLWHLLIILLPLLSRFIFNMLSKERQIMIAANWINMN